MLKVNQDDIKKDYSEYIANATILIHSPEGRDAVLAMLDNNDPVQKVAKVAVTIMQRVDAAARAKGWEVQDSIKAVAAGEIVKLIVELGNAAKKFNLNEDLELLAMSVTVQDYVKSEVKLGRMDAKRVKVVIDADMRQMSPAKRKEVQQSQAKLQQIARKYNHGKGLIGGVR